MHDVKYEIENNWKMAKDEKMAEFDWSNIETLAKM